MDEIDAWPAEQLERVEACPACGAGDRRPVYDALVDAAFGVAPGAWESVACANCGCLYLPVRPTEASIGRAYADYYTHGEAIDPLAAVSGARRERRRVAELQHLREVWGYPLGEVNAKAGVALGDRRGRALDRMVRHLPARPAGRLLDVGCGNGAFLGLMARLGWQVTGVEPDPRARSIAIASGLPVVVERLGDLGDDDPPFDAITLDHVIEHVHDPLGTLIALWARLAPGGCLWLATPNPASAGHRRYGRAWFPLQPPTHLALYPRAALEALLERAGLAGTRHFPTTFEAKWCFEASACLARGLDPFRPKALGPWTRRLTRHAARRADSRTRRHPSNGEELVVRVDKARLGA